MLPLAKKKKSSPLRRVLGGRDQIARVLAECNRQTLLITQADSAEAASIYLHCPPANASNCVNERSPSDRVPPL